MTILARSDSFPFVDKDDDLKTVQNARLLCRRFCEIASPRLVPELNASIRSKSLHCIDKLTRNPLVAAGIRLVQLVLKCRPTEVAQDLNRYKNMQHHKVFELWTECDWHTERLDPATMSENELKLLDAKYIHHDIMAQCNEYHGAQLDEERNDLHELLYRCF